MWRFQLHQSPKAPISGDFSVFFKHGSVSDLQKENREVILGTVMISQMFLLILVCILFFAGIVSCLVTKKNRQQS
uniref:GOLD domain-containing protein n=1 Tax=Steinernema glaseri TaxID=37863 RepID=A0A1I8A0Y2_9BILA